MTWPEIDLVIGMDKNKHKVRIVLLLNLSSLFHSTKYRKVTLNVGGKKHDILWSTLATKPKTRLGKLAMAVTHEEILNYCDSYSLDDNEFFFNIQTKNFRNILNFYQSGKLHMVDEMCCMAFSGRFFFWHKNYKIFKLICYLIFSSNDNICR